MRQQTIFTVEHYLRSLYHEVGFKPMTSRFFSFLTSGPGARGGQPFCVRAK